MDLQTRVEKQAKIRHAIEDHDSDMCDRWQAMRLEFIAHEGRVFFGANTKAGPYTKGLISCPGDAAAVELAAALNRVLAPYRALEKKTAADAAHKLKAEVTRLMDELTAGELAEINEAAAEKVIPDAVREHLPQSYAAFGPAVYAFGDKPDAAE